MFMGFYGLVAAVSLIRDAEGEDGTSEREPCAPGYGPRRSTVRDNNYFHIYSHLASLSRRIVSRAPPLAAPLLDIKHFPLVIAFNKAYYRGNNAPAGWSDAETRAPLSNPRNRRYLIDGRIRDIALRGNQFSPSLT